MDDIKKCMSDYLIESSVRFINRENKTIVLRPDHTLCIVQSLKNMIKDESNIFSMLKLFYADTVFRKHLYTQSQEKFSVGF